MANGTNQLSRREKQPNGLTEIAGWSFLLPFFFFLLTVQQRRTLFHGENLSFPKDPFRLRPKLRIKREVLTFLILPLFFFFILLIPHTFLSTHSFLITYTRTHIRTLTPYSHTPRSYPYVSFTSTEQTKTKMSTSLTGSTSDAPKIRRVALMGSRAVGKQHYSPLIIIPIKRHPSYIRERGGEGEEEKHCDSSLFFVTSRLTHRYHGS